MTEQLCPICGCQIVDAGYKKGGVLYCCKPCATGSQCQCGCCEAVEGTEEEESESCGGEELCP